MSAYLQVIHAYMRRVKVVSGVDAENGASDKDSYNWKSLSTVQVPEIAHSWT